MPSLASTIVSSTQRTNSSRSAKIGDISEEIQDITAGHEEFVETGSLEVTIEVATLLASLEANHRRDNKRVETKLNHNNSAANPQKYRGH